MRVLSRAARRFGIAIATCLIGAGIAVAATADMADKGVGPVKAVKLGAIDPALAKRGGEAFEQKCSACHKFDERYVGPPIGGVTQRRSPEWIMNMILNPQEMTAENETAKHLLGEYMTQMTFQNVSEPDARAILEFFRQHDSGGAAAAGKVGQAKPAK